MLEPARQQGLRAIWIAGVSMGGLGTLIVASAKPGAAERLILLSPYLGPTACYGEIEAAGGPARWTPTEPAIPISASGGG